MCQPSTEASTSPSSGDTTGGLAPGYLRRIDRADLLRIGVVVVCAIIALVGVEWPSPRLPLVALIGLVVGLWPIMVEAWHDLRDRRMSMELSMLIAIVAAAAIGEWVTALVVCAFVLAAEILEDLTMDRGRDALTDLMSFLPAEVRLLGEDGQTTTVALDQVAVGDIVVVPPGGKLSVDGEVVAGESSLDQSRITGESLPVDVGVGSAVFAGSVNQTGLLHVRATRVGEESSYGQIVESVRQAQSSRAPVQRLADRLSAYLVYVALAAAVVTFIVTRDWRATISVVLVAGACGVAAGTPLAVLAAIARSARHGAFVKGGGHLEQLSSVDTIVFDKTGTLTVGQPRVVEVLAREVRPTPPTLTSRAPVQPATAIAPTTITASDPNVSASDSLPPTPNVPAADLLRYAAAVETGSEHPLGLAILDHARDLGLTIPAAEDFAYTPGLGVSALVEGRQVSVGKAAGHDRQEASHPDGHPGTVATQVQVSIDGRVMGVISLADQVRDSAARAVSELQSMTIRTIMLTGDRADVARAVGDQVGIADARGALLPNEKLAVIDAERAAGHRVAMVGDGVNDAPALAHASVGIAMGSGTEIARHSADIVLISSNLDDLTTVVRTARRARAIIWFNFVGTLVVDAIGMSLAAFSLIGPATAAAIHVISETAFILNSARLLPHHR
jgi:cation transport ATPase